MNKHHRRKIKRWISTLSAPLKKKVSKDTQSMPFELQKKLKILEHRGFTEGAKGHPNCGEIHKLWDGKMDIYRADKTAEYKTTLADTKVTLDQTQKELDEQTEDQQIQSELRIYQEQQDKELLKQEKKNGEITEVLESKYVDRREKQADLNAQKVNGEVTPVSKSTMDTRKAIIGTFTGMTLLEGSMTYSAVEQLGMFSSIGILIFVGLYSAAIGGLCHLSGYYYGIQKIKGSVLAATTAFLFVSGIIMLRSYAQEEAFDWVLDLINIAFVLACILVSCRLHETRSYWRTKEAIAKLNQSIDKSNSALNLFPKTLKTIDSKYLSRVTKKVRKERSIHKEKLAELNREQCHIQAKYDNELTREKAFRQEGHYAIQQSFQDGQNANQ